MLIDQNNDVTFSHLRQVLSTYPQIKEHVKVATVGEEYRASLPINSFADRANRRFPVASSADSILSKAYATKVANLAPSIMAEIDTALELYGIPSSLFATTKEASAPSAEPSYLLEEQKKLPLYATTSTKEAEYHLLRNKHKLRPSTLVKAASKLIKHAYAKGDNVSSETLKYAGLVQADVEEITPWLEARATKASSLQTKEAYSKLASITSKLDHSVSRTDLIKLANTIGELDELEGFSAYYNKKLPDPYSTVFNTKTAMQPTMVLGDKDVPLEKLLAIDPSVYGDLLGSDIVEEISEDGEIVPENLIDIFETLPLDMKKLIVTKLGL